MKGSSLYAAACSDACCVMTQQRRFRSAAQTLPLSPARSRQLRPCDRCHITGQISVASRRQRSFPHVSPVSPGSQDPGLR
eukprot:13066250-Heterocapsa_arctica.AAC.1